MTISQILWQRKSVSTLDGEGDVLDCVTGLLQDFARDDLIGPGIISDFRQFNFWTLQSQKLRFGDS